MEESTLDLRGGLCCIRCGKRDRPWELLWGCGDCFRREKARRRDVELFHASLGRQLPAATEEWLKNRLRRWSSSRVKAIRDGKVPFGQSSIPSCGEMPRRETRCKDCWRFPTRRKGFKADAVYEELDSRFWCDACQARLWWAMDKSEKVKNTTSVR